MYKEFNNSSLYIVKTMDLVNKRVQKNRDQGKQTQRALFINEAFFFDRHQQKKLN